MDRLVFFSLKKEVRLTETILLKLIGYAKPIIFFGVYTHTAHTNHPHARVRIHIVGQIA